MPPAPSVQVVDTRQDIDGKAIVLLAVDSQTSKQMNSAKFAFFPPSLAIYRIKKSENGKLTVVSSSSSMPIPLADDSSLDVLLIDTNRGNKIVAFYLKNPYARLTLLYSHGNDVDFSRFL
ncbi:hypothetical protein QYF36_024065 [Acer negundo]|nr:hypothetical protein QYF36_024065 [Acer negundo]